jgi:hypothetical protein
LRRAADGIATQGGGLQAALARTLDGLRAA